MVDSTFLLYQMQKIDSEIITIETKSRKITDEMNNDLIIRDAEQSFMSISAALATIQDKSNALDIKINTYKNKSGQFTSSLYGGKIQNSKELNELQSEIANLKDSIRVFEDEQMKNWEEIETLQSQQKNAEENLASAKILHSGQKGLYLESLGNYQKEIERLSVEKIGIIKQLSPSFVDLYKKLVQTKKGTAVSQVEDSSCQCCGTTLTPSDCQQAKNHSTITFCKNCGRILYAG